MPGSALDSDDRRRSASAQSLTVRSGGGCHRVRVRFDRARKLGERGVDFVADDGADCIRIGSAYELGSDLGRHGEELRARGQDEVVPFRAHLLDLNELAATDAVLDLDLLGLRRGKPLALRRVPLAVGIGRRTLLGREPCHDRAGVIAAVGVSRSISPIADGARGHAE